MRLLLGVISALATMASPAFGQALPGPTDSSSPQFTRVSAVRELSDGSVLISDRGEQAVYHFHWGRAETRRVMRDGQGPGEYRGVGRIFALSGDSSLFIDGFDFRWSLLDRVDVVDTYSEGRRINQALGTKVAGVADSLILGWPTLGRESVDSVPLILGSWHSGDHREIARLAPISRDGFTVIRGAGERPDHVIGGNPLAGADLAVMASDGWIAVVRGNPYRVEWRRPDGTWILGSPLPFDPIPVDRAERCFAVERYIPHDCEVELPGWPEIVPPFLPPGIMPDIALPVLLATPDQRVVIARTPTRRTGLDATRYDIVDREGQLVRTLTLTGGRRIVGFGEASVFVVRKNELGLQTIDRHPWPGAHPVP